MKMADLDTLDSPTLFLRKIRETKDSVFSHCGTSTGLFYDIAVFFNYNKPKPKALFIKR